MACSSTKVVQIVVKNRLIKKWKQQVQTKVVNIAGISAILSNFVNGQANKFKHNECNKKLLIASSLKKWGL